MDILENCISTGKSRFAVVKGNAEKIRDTFRCRYDTESTNDKAAIAMGDAELHDKIVKQLYAMVSDITKIKKEDLAADVEFTKYGFDNDKEQHPNGWIHGNGNRAFGRP